MRGRNNRNSKGPNPLTRSYESNGPDVKIRGTAQHIAEKYSQLSRDAQASGDPIAAENYLQHAEHYFRIIAASQEQMRQQYGEFQRFSDDEQEEGEGEGDENGNGFGYDSASEQPASEDVDYAYQPQPQSQPRHQYENQNEGRQQQRPQRRSRYGRIDRSHNYNNDQPRNDQRSDQPRNDGEGYGDDQGGMRRRSRFGRPQQQHDHQQPVIEQPVREQPPVREEQPIVPQRRTRAPRQEVVADDAAPGGLPAFLTTPVRQAAPARTEASETLFGETALSEEAPKPVRRRRVTTKQDAGGEA